MGTGKVIAYYGTGRGKTSAALGYAIHEASRGGSVVIIQFLKQREDGKVTFIGRLEPEIRLFRFQKSEKFYEELSESEQAEERMNMKNGLNYARKVLQTGECSMLILDEVLGLADCQIISEEELISLISLRSEDTELVLTGRVMSENLLAHVDAAYELTVKKENGSS